LLTRRYTWQVTHLNFKESVMINLQTYSEVLRRVSELERMEGNCGRAFRRFLKQMFFGKTSQLLSVEYVGYSLDLTEEEEAALTSSVEGYAAELSPRAAHLLKYFKLEKFDAMSYMSKALLKAA
jgi:hypothetical protein